MKQQLSSGDGHPERTGEVFRIIRTGTFQALTGPVVVTAEHLAGIVAAFDHLVSAAREAGGEPAFPAAKVDHIDTPATPVAGLVKAVWTDGDWLMGEVAWTDQALARQALTGGLSRVSAEIDYDVTVYGEAFPARLVSLALLPAETLPAVPGAGVVRVVASTGDMASMRVRLTCGDDEDETSKAAATEQENIMEEKILAALAGLTEGLAGVQTTLTALAGKLDGAAAKDAEAATAAAAAADAASLTAFGAKLSAAVTEGKVTQGEAEELTAVAQALPVDGRAKLAASLEKRPVAGIPAEKLPNSAPAVKLSAEEKGERAQALIRAKLAADPGNYAGAVTAAMREKPELFAAEEEVK
jgi:hypothetical protein